MDDTSNLLLTESEKWQFDHYAANSIHAQINSNPTASEVANSFWPFQRMYFSPLNPIFTSMFAALDRDSNLPGRLWMLRDGAIPLTWFFKKNSSNSVPGQLLVPIQFKSLVPQAWADQVLFYGMRSRAEKLVAKSLLIAGPICEKILNLAELEKILDRIEGRIGKKRLASMNVQIYCPVRNGDGFPLKFCMQMCARFPHAKAIDWFTLANIGNLQGTAYVDLNGGWYYQDSFVRHHVLSRGAHLLFEQKTKVKVSNFIPLSQFHGVELLKSEPKNSLKREESERIKNYYLFMAKFENKTLRETSPWPEWHENWCRASMAGLLSFAENEC